MFASTYGSCATLWGHENLQIAVGQIMLILYSTVLKSQFYGIASSKWVDYIYIYGYEADRILNNFV